MYWEQEEYRWIDEGIVLDQIVEIPQHLQGQKLLDLVDVEGRWNWSLFQSWFPAEILKKIAAVIPPSADQGDDARIMLGSSSNSFSVSSLYMNLSGYHGDMENTTWKRIWKLHVPERVKTFTWMTLHAWEIVNKLFEKQDEIMPCDVCILWRCGGNHSTCFA
jgi:hypothetical protein